MQNLEKTIGYSFKNQALLQMAFVHSSCVDEANYERMEFLGDSVLGLVIADFLYRNFPDESEGNLAKRLSQLVRGETLVIVAEGLNLAEHMKLSDAEENTGGRAKKGNVEDICEALIGAIYLDGGFESAKEFILKYWKDKALDMAEIPHEPKTKLQEVVQGMGMSLPLYETIGKEGLDHEPIFTVQVKIDSGEFAVAKGASKKAAMKEAAKTLLAELDK